MDGTELGLKNAYLIIAHNEFEVLNTLLSLIDDINNDVFIHFDKKVNEIPAVKLFKSKLVVLDDRVDVRWGHISQIEVMLKLLKNANSADNYAHLHLISGVHIPIKSKKYINDFFKEKEGISILNSMVTSEGEIKLKLKRYNLFVKNFISHNKHVQVLSQFLWKLGHKVQNILSIRRDKFKNVYKASQWASLTQEASNYLVENTDVYLTKYRYTFCSDEFFLATELRNSFLYNKVSFDNRLLKCEFQGAGPRVYNLSDFDDIILSNCIFARKFSNEHMDLVDKIKDMLKE